MNAMDGPNRSEKRAKRSTRIGIAVIIGLAILTLAIVWGVERWDENGGTGPLVYAPIELASASYMAPAA